MGLGQEHQFQVQRLRSAVGVVECASRMPPPGSDAPSRTVTERRFPWAREHLALSLPDPNAGLIQALPAGSPLPSADSADRAPLQIAHKQTGAVIANVKGRSARGMQTHERA